MDRLRDKKFWAMMVAAMGPQAVLYLNGQIDAKTALSVIISALVAGVFGIMQPAPPQKRSSPLKIE